MYNPLVEIKDIHKSFGPLEVLKGVDFSVNQGEVVCLIGKSGSGKSTLLRCINLLETPDSGMIHVFGEDVLSIKDVTSSVNASVCVSNSSISLPITLSLITALCHS